MAYILIAGLHEWILFSTFGMVGYEWTADQFSSFEINHVCTLPSITIHHSIIPSLPVLPSSSSLTTAHHHPQPLAFTSPSPSSLSPAHHTLSHRLFVAVTKTESIENQQRYWWSHKNFWIRSAFFRKVTSITISVITTIDTPSLPLQQFLSSLQSPLLPPSQSITLFCHHRITTIVRTVELPGWISATVIFSHHCW